MFEYLLKTSLSLSFFYAFFHLFLRSNTFFKANRIYLLFALTSSFAISFVPIPGNGAFASEPIINTVVNDELEPFEQSEIATIVSPPFVSVRELLVAFYFAGVCLIALRNFIQRKQLASLRKRGRRYHVGKACVIKIEGPYSFSFFRTLFISDKQSQHAIIQHEKAHIVQWHWLDLVIIECALAVLWFNPVMWFFKRSMREQHEYLADDFVLKKGTSLSTYLSIILHSIRDQHVVHGLINQFNSNPLKTRIIMMTKNKTARVRRLTYVMTAPLLMILLLSFGRKIDVSSLPKEKQVTIIIDAAHGGQDAGTSNGDVTEKELSLRMARMIGEACAKKGIHAILTREGDQSLSLNERIGFATKENASLLISIHFAHDKDPKIGGIDCLINKESSSYDQSLRAGSFLLEKLKSLYKVNGVKNSSALILKGNIPSVILELGYLSNASDLSFIADRSNQTKIAGEIADSIVAFSK